MDLIVTQFDLSDFWPDHDSGRLPTFATIFDPIVANDRAVRRSINVHSPTYVVANGVFLERDIMGGHWLRLFTPVDSAELISQDRVVAHDIVTVLMANRHAVTAILLEPIPFRNTATNSPAEKESIFAVSDCSTIRDDWALRSAARMESESGAVGDCALFDTYIIGLLKANAIAVVVSHLALAHDAVITTVEENTCRPASVDFGGIVFAISVDGQVFHSSILQLVSADHRIDCRRKSTVCHHDIGIHVPADRKVAFFPIQQRRAHAVKIPLCFGGHVNTSPDLESLGVGDGNRRLAKITVGHQRGAEFAILFQDGGTPGAANGNAAAQV